LFFKTFWWCAIFSPNWEWWIWIVLSLWQHLEFHQFFEVLDYLRFLNINWVSKAVEILLEVLLSLFLLLRSFLWFLCIKKPLTKSSFFFNCCSNEASSLYMNFSKKKFFFYSWIKQSLRDRFSDPFLRIN